MVIAGCKEYDLIMPMSVMAALRH